MKIENFIDGKASPASSSKYLDVYSPLNNEKICEVAISSQSDVDKAISGAEKAFVSWSQLTTKARCKLMHKFYFLIEQHKSELAQIIHKEHGKTMNEAIAEVAKGNESVEWATGLATVSQYSCSTQQVSGSVTCREELRPIGLVCSIVPFNFPAMVPLWTLPVAIASGNCLILKPSEKCPMTIYKIISELSVQAGIPAGVLQIINGDKSTVECLISHPSIQATTFVGSSFVAELIYKQVTSLGKRCLALGGAKNHLIALPDCEIDMTSTDIVSSFAGCAGERCMAASVLILVGDNEKLLQEVKRKCIELSPGADKGYMGPVIDGTSRNKIISCLQTAEKSSLCEILLDGRSDKWMNKEGTYIGPSIVLHKDLNDVLLSTEIFGPFLSVLQVDSVEKAIEIENRSEFGNAACIYTSNGGKAEWFCSRLRAGMLGVNIGIPVPREPFSFGGLYGTKSMFGHGDITGQSALSFFTNRVKITTKWSKFETDDVSQFK